MNVFHTFFIQSSAGGYLACFWIYSIVNWTCLCKCIKTGRARFWNSSLAVTYGYIFLDAFPYYFKIWQKYYQKSSSRLDQEQKGANCLWAKRNQNFVLHASSEKIQNPSEKGTWKLRMTWHNTMWCSLKEGLPCPTDTQGQRTT